MMGRQREKLRKAIRQAENEFTNEFVEIPESKWPAGKRPEGLTKVFRNNQFIVELYCYVKNPFTFDGSIWTKVMVRHNTGKPVVQWSHLQDIKNQIFGKQTLGIQYLPPESKLVDAANMYWFFVKGVI